MLESGKQRKSKLAKSQKNKQRKSLSRKQQADLGLFTLPTKSMKYTDLMPLHDLWSEYIVQHLGLSNMSVAPEPDSPTYDAFSKLFIKADFHGAIVTVTRSRCPGLVGTNGIIAMDTKNTFKILGKDNKLRSKDYQQ